MALSRRLFTQLLLGTAASTLAPSAAFGASQAEAVLRATTQMTDFGDLKRTSEIWRFLNASGGTALRGVWQDDFSVQINNDLKAATAVHWHGLRVPNEYDGVPGEGYEPIVAGGSESFAFKLKDPGTYWYHSHNRGWEQVARGLYGPFVIENPNEPQIPDFTVVIDDWTINRSEKLDWSTLGDGHSWSHGGNIGNLVTVNAEIAPTIEVPSYGYFRLRFLNAATARLFTPIVAALKSKVIALDGFGTRPFDPQDDFLILGPSQRIDLLVDATEISGQTIEINEGDAPLFYLSANGEVDGGGTDTPEGFQDYRPEELIPDQRASQKVQLYMAGGAMGSMQSAKINGRETGWRGLMNAKKFWSFNGYADGGPDPLFKAKVGETVDLHIINDSGWPHVIHFHGHHVLTRRNEAVPYEQGKFRDGVTLAPGTDMELSLKVSEPGSWLLHCHMLGHQVSGMSTWYDVS